MPIIKQKWIMREDLRNNPDILYVFGDNLKRVGYGGQAKEMRDEPNAVGVATKRAPGMNPHDFFTDAMEDELKGQIWTDMERIRNHLLDGGTVIIPADGLGTGLSELPKRAPKVNAYLEQELVNLQYL